VVLETGKVRGVADDDAGLVKRARRGDVGAYERLVERHQHVAFRVAYVLCGNAADAEEAAQDGFVKAYAALGRFRPGAPLRPWLLTIVANEARSRARAAGRRERLSRRAAGQLRDTSGAPSAEALALGSERDAELRDALATLDDRDREVIWLRYFTDLTEAEMAATLDCRPGTIKSRLSRALSKLRTTLEDTDA
jgi:RNA polymerase sigma-70 factor (ECF subfamily)